MESGKNKLTTKQQFEKLVELMEKHPETARGKPQFGCSKNKIKELWEQFAVELNSLGPPSRTAHDWGRVWIHYKANLKRKLANNRSNCLATGGGPSQEVSLSALEESVAQLIQIKEQVAPGVHSFGVENIELVMNDDEMGDNFACTSPVVCEPQTANVERPTSTASQIIKGRRKIQNLETERLELLKTQAETQKKLLRKIEQMEKTVYKNFEVNKKILQIKQQKLDIYKKQAKEAHELHTLKVEVEKLKIVKMGGTLLDKGQ